MRKSADWDLLTCFNINRIPFLTYKKLKDSKYKNMPIFIKDYVI